MKTVTFIISSLSSGGAERVLTTLLKEFSKEFNVELITLKAPSSDFFSIDDIDVNRSVVTTNLKSNILSNIIRVFKIRKLLKNSKSENIISFIDQMNILTVLASLGLKKNVIISERTNPEIYQLSKAWELLRKITYKHASKVVIQTEGLKKWASNLKISSSKVKVIGNPLSPMIHKQNTLTDQIDIPKNYILGIGRLDQNKGFHYLINCFQLLSKNFPDLYLLIIGDGTEKNNLKNQCIDLKISDKVIFLGRQKNVGFFLKKAIAFTLTSKFEGFPNVLLESLSVGCPSIAFNCNYGPSEMLPEEYLIEYGDTQSLYITLKNTIESQDKSKDYFNEYSKSINNLYSIQQIYNKWTELLK